MKFVFVYEIKTEKGISIPFTSVIESYDAQSAFFDLRKQIFEDKSMKLFKKQPKLTIKDCFSCSNSLIGYLAQDDEIAIYLT